MEQPRPQIKYPVGIQSFAEIRQGGYLYVDKTAFIHRLAGQGKYYFLSRPRRFGKSLLLSTLEAFYLGRRELFEGLDIERLATDWEPHPVLHLDLNSDEYIGEESLATVLKLNLAKWEKDYGVADNDNPLSYRFGQVIQRAYDATGRKVVILVDEYDKPILNAIDNEELSERFRSTLKAFYSNLKSKDQFIEFAILTGVARFSKVSIFSDLNNLRDITFEEEFAAICGMSDDEVDRYFGAGIEALARRTGKTYGQTRERLRTSYDGYHFAEDSPGVYNPFSLVNVFASNRFANYWFESGTPSYLVRLLERRRMNISRISGFKIGASALRMAGISTAGPIPALYQSGYLTIAGYDPERDIYELDYPNREVRESFLKFLVPYYTRISREETDFAISQFADDVLEGRPEDFMGRLQSLVARIPYGKGAKAPEDHFQNAVYLIFTLLGYQARVEERTSAGRIDLTVEVPGRVYIFEFKIDSTAAEAVSQIRSKNYDAPYGSSGKTVYLIGASFDSSTRTLADILIETL